MSRLWPHQLTLNVEPHRIEITLHSGWPTAKVIHHAVVDCTDNAGQGLTLPLALIDQLIQAYGKSAHCHIVLSNHFIRHLILLAYDATITDAELAVLARHCFTEVYGAKSDEWTIITDYEHQLACAIESAVLTSLKAICQTHKATLRSVNSFLVNIYNQRQDIIGAGVQALIQIEKNLLVIALFKDHRWMSLTTHQCSISHYLEIKRLIERELLLSGIEQPLQNILVTHQSDISAREIEAEIAADIKAQSTPHLRVIQHLAANLPA